MIGLPRCHSSTLAAYMTFHKFIMISATVSELFFAGDLSFPRSGYEEIN